MKALRNLMVSLIVVSGSCASVTAKDHRYSGEYFYNFENAYLTPDGKNEAWCLNGDMAKAELPAKDASGPWGTSHVVVRGKLGPVGHFGNLGMCKRVLTVTELVTVSNMRGRE